jgi:hypothetical protein
MSHTRRLPRFWFCIVSAIGFYLYTGVALAQECPNGDIRGVVLERHADPALSLVYAKGQCKSNVTEQVARCPSWEVMKRGLGVKASVNDAKVIFHLEPIPDRDLPKGAVKNAEKAGLR